MYLVIRPKKLAGRSIEGERTLTAKGDVEVGDEKGSGDGAGGG